MTKLRCATAAHEAGHAVVGWELGLPVESLMIVGDDGKGLTIMAEPRHLAVPDQIAVWMAGIVAQDLLKTVRWWQDGMADHARIVEAVGDLPDEEQENIRADGFARARNLKQAFGSTHHVGRAARHDRAHLIRSVSEDNG